MKKRITLWAAAAFVSAFTAVSTSTAATAHKLPEQVEVTFVLDTTGSMARLIDGAKRKIWSIANTIVDINPDADIRMALVGYRDFGDDYVIKSHAMTDDLQDLYAKLNQLTAAGGGDTPEAVNEALHASLHKVKWSAKQSTRKFIFLVGDAPPHMDYNGPQYPELLKIANQRGIIVNAVQAGRSRNTRKIWQEIALNGDGDYIPLPQDGGQIVIIETPYDDEIIILQKSLDETVIPYGEDFSRNRVRSNLRSKSTESHGARLESSTFYAKRTGKKEVITGGGDLVTELQNGRVKLDSYEPQKLPKALRKKSSDEQKNYVRAMIQRRTELKSKMAELVKKRSAYLKKAEAAAPKPKGDSFDRAVSKAISSKF